MCITGFIVFIIINVLIHYMQDGIGLKDGSVVIAFIVMGKGKNIWRWFYKGAG